MYKVKTLPIKQLLDAAKEKEWASKQRGKLAEQVAASLLQESNRLATKAQKKRQDLLARLVLDKEGKVLFTEIADQAFRCQSPKRAVNQIVFLLNTYGIPSFLSKIEQIAVKALSFTMPIFPKASFFLVKKLVRAHTRHVILDDDFESLKAHIKKRKTQGIEVNVNFIGEAVLGEEEAQKRLELYTKALRSGAITALSIKVSTISSKLSLLGFSHTLEVLKIQFRKILDAALEAPEQTLVALDMEEYKDLELTKQLYISVLGEEKYYPLQVAIALQAYIPDSYQALVKIAEFAEQRYKKGGKPLRVRLVKGANLSTEQITSSLSGFPQAPFATKKEVDAQYKKMLHYAFNFERAKALHIGVASHNLFDIGYALVLAAEENVEEAVSFEMLEGMADPLPQILAALTGRVLLYAPVTNEKEFAAAFAYLVRRLDETTYDRNFLKDAFGLVPGSDRWNRQKEFFESSIPLIGSVSEKRRRRQSRLQPVSLNRDAPFDNDFHTDPTLPDNRLFAESIVKKWCALPPCLVFPEVAGEKIGEEGRDKSVSLDPSNPGRVVAYTVLINEEDAQKSIDSAYAAQRELSSFSPQERSEMLYQVACEMQKARADLIGAMMAEGGKPFEEADLEVSEAIDFIEYYRRQIVDLGKIEDVIWKPVKVGVIASPWNFPLAIPTGGVAALLLTGSPVLFKPAPEVPLIGSLLVDCFYKAGIDRKFLQFIPCKDEPVGSSLLKNSKVEAVILTGATETAKKLLQMRKGLSLFAETGGKNAMIVSALADRDLAVKDLVSSAFGHAGQKCSACSLAILEKEVYQDPRFLQTLKDAAKSLQIGSVWELQNKVGPLIHPPEGKLLKGLTELEEGESWLLEPKQHAQNPNIWTPGIKLGVRPFSFTQQTELFGPVLGLMCASDFSEALELANSTRYGLTAGLQSLDKREMQQFTARMQAGNLYVNRSTTGAIVRRQPFGGCKDSSFGPGKKAGGPNYLIQLMQARSIALPNQKDPLPKHVDKCLLSLQKAKLSQGLQEQIFASAYSYSFYWNHYFCKEQDKVRLLGQDNFLRYVPKKAFIHLQQEDREIDILQAAVAALTCQSSCLFFIGNSEAALRAQKWLKKEKAIGFTSSLEEFEKEISASYTTAIRTFSPPSDETLVACQNFCAISYFRPVVSNGRIELLHYLREIAVSTDYHRYGNLGLREEELRKGPLKL